ncbi:MAG TPA: hypothetical protein VHP63_03690, partial [candidate division Zixibacteria bacterium]|nr:hypothetical protein [candidate division Zixibacteria bacterium]
MLFKNFNVCLVWALFLFVTPVLWADEGGEQSNGKNIREFTSREGRIDLNALRQSGYQGSLNIEGLNVLIDPITGELVAKYPPGISSATDSNDIYWDNTPSNSLPDISGEVDALAIYDSKLIAAGWFLYASGKLVNNIAAWDGNSWSSLGSGITTEDFFIGGVRALIVYDGKLIAGGDFNGAGGISANNIASWDGTNWSPLANGTGGEVRSMIIYDNKVIVGGTFTFVSGVPANYIASWNGNSWSGLGAGLEYNGVGFPRGALALTVFNNKLIAAGRFTSAGGAPAYHIAAWDGSSWSEVGLGMNHMVFALTVYEGNLIAGGGFTTAGNIPANFIASWNGQSWSPLGSGLNSDVYS